MKDSLDQLLEDTVREWASTKPVSIGVIPEGRGGPQAVEVTPQNSRALSVRLWVADDAQHVACGIGAASWWNRAVPLERDAILQLLAAVAGGAAWEEVQHLGKHIVGRRGCIQLPSKRLSFRSLIVIPGIRWRRAPHEAY
jgi:hypothetical protein